MGNILNKKIFYLSSIAIISISQLTFASEQAPELKKSCLKDHALVSSELDSNLINIYSQICDKKNKKNIVLQNELLIQAAQQYQKLGHNLKALQLVDSLRKQNIQHTALTDISFLAGVDIANKALQQMRNNEMRYLSLEGTYPAAKQLSDGIRASLPEPDTSDAKPVSISVAKPKKMVKSSPVKTTTNRVTNKAVTPSRSKPANVAATPVKVPAAQPKASGSSPFASLK